MFTENTPKNAVYAIYACCINCNFKCFKKSDYDRHLLTSKHKKYTNSIQLFTQNTSITPNLNCDNCNKIYKSRMGLWKHKKKCIKENTFLEKVIKEEIVELKDKAQYDQEQENIIMQIEEIKEEKEDEKLNNLIEIQKQNQEIINELLKQN